MTTLLVNLGGLALMGAIIWWFWLSSPRPVEAAQTDQTEVNNR